MDLLQPFRWITDTFFQGNVNKVTKEGDGYFYSINSSTIDLPYKTMYDIFRLIPHLQLVILRKASMFSNVRFVIKKTNTEEDEIDYDNPLNDILTNPNKLQSWRQMLFMLCVIRCINGISFLYPGFGLVRKPRALQFLKPVDFETYDIETDKSKNWLIVDEITELIKKYVFHTQEGQTLEYTADQLLTFKDAFVGYTKNPSKVFTLLEPLKNIYKALVARGILIDRKGGIGALTGNQKDGGTAVPMKKGEKKKIQERLENFGLGKGKDSIIVTDVPMKWQSFVFPTSQLMLFEEIVDDFNTICDEYGMCRELFIGDAAYASTRSQAETDTYVNTIVPEWEDFFDQLNDGLNTKAENIRIEADFAHIGALQKNKKADLEVQRMLSDLLMQELAKGIIDENEYRQQMGYAPKEETEEDEEDEEEIENEDDELEN